MWLSGTQTHGIRTALVSPIFPHLYKWLRERTREGFLCRAGTVTSKGLEPDERLRGPETLLESRRIEGVWGGILYVENRAKLPTRQLSYSLFPALSPFLPKP